MGDKLKSIISNFINYKGYEEKDIEENITKLIKDECKNITSLSVFYITDDDKIKIRLYCKYENILDSFKYDFDFNKENIINSVRKHRLNKILKNE